MTCTPVLLTRGACLAAVAATIGVLACTHQVAQFAVADAPVLAGLQLPLYLAVGAGALLTVAVAVTGWTWSPQVAKGRRSDRRAVLTLGWLLGGVGLLGVYVAVCTIGMSVVLDGLDLGAPGVVLAAICAEVVLGAVLLALAHQHRQARIELAYARRNRAPALTG